MRVLKSYEQQIIDALMRLPAPQRGKTIEHTEAQATAIRAVLAPLYRELAAHRELARVKTGVVCSTPVDMSAVE